MKKIVLAVFGAALLVLVWYLFIRSYEFEVNFKTATLPGDVIQTIRIWDKSHKDVEVTSIDSIFLLVQKVTRGTRSYIYHWNFETLNDSLTQVKIRITEPAASLKNKILIPFTVQPVETDARDIVGEFYDVLRTHLEITSVTAVSESETSASFCVCRTIQTPQTDKAIGMMKNYGFLTSFIADFNLKPVGPPLVKVEEWNHEKGNLKFDFCFPIEKTGYLPAVDSVSYRDFAKQKVLKATYRGNYITSDRAWYTLLHFAKQNGFKTGLPIEQFYNNPTLGLDEKGWRADIYLPIL